MPAQNVRKAIHKLKSAVSVIETKEYLEQDVPKDIIQVKEAMKEAIKLLEVYK